MDPREALSRIELIREHLARAEVFHVYRAASVIITGLMAFAGAAIQARWELGAPDHFLTLWISIAIVCAMVVGIEMVIRCRWSDSILLRDAAIVASRQFAPCVVAGGLLTLVLYRFIPDAVHLLPGLWSICFALGVFASRPGLPRAINFAGAWYLLTGLIVLAYADNRRAFEIWPMPLSFGVGQILTAVILFIQTERPHAAQQ